MLHAKGGAVFASFLKLPVFGLFTIPGMASRIMYPGKCNSLKLSPQSLKTSFILTEAGVTTL